MKLRELIHYSKHILKGKRLNTIMICMLPLEAELFFRLAEACVYSLLLYFGEMKPISLFSGDNHIQLAFTFICTILRWIAIAPLSYAVAFRLCELCKDNCNNCTPISHILTDRRIFRRSFVALIWTKIICLIALIPAIFFGITAYSLVISSSSSSELFITIHAIVITIVSIGMWISLRLSLAAVPFLLVQFPQKSAFKTVIYAIKFMHGRKSTIIALILLSLPPMLTIIALPSALTGLKTSFSLCIDIYIKEDDYIERNKIHSEVGQASDITKISRRKKQRFKTIVDETQTSGRRNYEKWTANTHH